MISPVGSSSTAGTSGASRTQMGKDQFLALLVTQLRYQDPMSPMDSQQFASQLAQFSSLEQLTQLNDAMAEQIQASQVNALVNQTTLSASLLGRSIVAEGGQVTIPSSGAAKIRISVGTGGGQATLTLKDASGATVATRDLGTVPAGVQTLTLPADLPPGDYRYAVEVKGAGDVTVPVTTYTTGTVDGVLFENGGILLRLGTLEVPLDTVSSVEAGPGGAPAAKPLFARLAGLALGRP